MDRYLGIAIACLIIVATAACGASGESTDGAWNELNPVSIPEHPVQPADWPLQLPADMPQPWESLDSAGHVIPADRAASGINQYSDFTPGVERFSESGDVTDNGEASRVLSSPGGSAHAMYRIPLGNGQPGVVSVDANLLSGTGYYIGLADYEGGRWQWHGPFTDNHVRLSTARPGPWTSSLGNMFVTVLVHGGASIDCVGTGVNLVDPLDTTSPAQPTGLTAIAVDNGIQLDWDPVIAGDLAGYRIHHSTDFFSNAKSVRVKTMDGLQGLSSQLLPSLPAELLFVRVSAVDISGNASVPSELVSAAALPGEPLGLDLLLEQPSGTINESIMLTANGAQSYDFDTDGDGIYDITGDTSGSALVDTTALGIIRPAVRGTGSTENAVALGSVSLIISGNSRPVAVASADPAFGSAPLDVSFAGNESTDFDGSIVGGGWDFDGDGTYDVWDDTDIVHVTAASFNYTNPGVYNAKLRVVDDGGAWDVDTLSIVVEAGQPANQDPTAVLGTDLNSGDAPLLVQFDASASEDPDGSIVQYAWDWEGDGIFDGISYDPLASHVYGLPGVFMPAVRVLDNGGLADTATLQINVSLAGNADPQAVLSADPLFGDPGLAVELDGSASTDDDGSIVSYEWDFNGDGQYDSYGSTASAEYVYTLPGVYEATLRVTDDKGAQDTDSLHIHINEQLDPLSAWPRFGRDLRGTARSEFEGPDDNGMLWSVDLGAAIRSSPCIGPDGAVYVGCNDDRLYAFNPDGTVRWSYLTGGDVTSSPAIAADGTVYVGSRDNKLHAINPDGTKAWDYTTGDWVLSSPLVGPDGAVYFSSYDDNLYVLESDGSLRWNFATSGISQGIVSLDAGGNIYFGSADKSLYAVDPDGSLLWSFPTGGNITVAPLIGPDGNIYFGSFDDSFYAIDSSGNLLWSYATGNNIGSSAAMAADGTIYFGSVDDNLYALHPDGSLAWTYDAGSPIASSPAIDAEGRIYVGSHSDEVICLDAQGGLIWSYTTGNLVESSPAISQQGTLFVGSHDGNLFAFGDSLPNIPPTADLAADKTSSVAPFIINFDASGSTDSDGSIVKYEWDFNGDGAWDATGVTASATHTYPLRGWYSARVRVTDDQGATDTSELPITLPSAWSMCNMGREFMRYSPVVGTQTNNVSWTYTIGGLINSPAVCGPDGRIYFGGYDDKIYALHPDGSFAWSLAVGDSIRSSPAIADDGSIFVTCADGKLYAVDPQGNLKWDYDTGSPIYGSPAVSDQGSVLFGCWDFNVYSLDADGNLNWNYTTGNIVSANPALASDGSCYIASEDGKMYAISPSGNKLWDYDTAESLNYCSAAFDIAGNIIFSSNDGTLYSLGTDGSFNWSYNMGSGSFSGPAVSLDGTIYANTGSGELLALNPNGSFKWSFALALFTNASPTVGGDGSIYLGCNSGDMYAVNPNGTQKWTYDTGNSIVGSAMIGADGSVYVGNFDGKMFAFGP